MKEKLRRYVRRFGIAWNLRPLGITLLVLVCTAALGILVLALPVVLVEHRSLVLTSTERLAAESALRSALVQFLGGGVLVVGMFFTAVGFRLTRAGHITDRYSRSIEQLGSENCDVRIGGIYALERIARDSPSDRGTIAEVLTAFVREHTRTGHKEPSSQKVTADVQAAITVLGRMPGMEGSPRRLDFYHAGLSDAVFHGGDFRGALFNYCKLDGASFAEARLDNAMVGWGTGIGIAFSFSSCRGTVFVNSTYRGWFIAGDFTDADFIGCDLSGSDFGRRYAEDGNPPLPPAILANARLTRATLVGTNLRGVDLSSVRGLTQEQLSEAITDENTIPPRRWRCAEDEE